MSNEQSSSLSGNLAPRREQDEHERLDAEARRRGFSSHAERETFLHTLPPPQLPHYLDLEQAVEDGRRLRRLHEAQALRRRWQRPSKRPRSADEFVTEGATLADLWEFVGAYQDAKRAEWVQRECRRVQSAAEERQSVADEGDAEGSHQSEEAVAPGDRHALVRQLREMAECWGLTPGDLDEIFGVDGLSDPGESFPAGDMVSVGAEPAETSQRDGGQSGSARGPRQGQGKQAEASARPSR